METIKVYTEADSKGSLLAEVHRLQSSLAAMRQARDFHGANSADLMRERDRLQREIEQMSDGINDGYRRDVRNAQLAAAWGQVNAESAHGPCSVCSDGGQELCKRHGAKQEAPAPVGAGLVGQAQEAYGRAAMADGSIRSGIIAALRVAADALLAELRRTLKAQTTLPDDHIAAITNTIRTRLLAPEKSLAATEPKEQA